MHIVYLRAMAIPDGQFLLYSGANLKRQLLDDSARVSRSFGHRINQIWDFE